MGKTKKTENDERENLIVQHNHLLEAKYHMTLQEKRLMYWLGSHVRRSDEDFKEHELCIKELSKLINVKGDHLYKTLNEITNKLMHKIITIRSLDNRDYKKSHLLGGVHYVEGEGIVKLSFHPYLRPYMLQLTEGFTQIKLGEILGLRSAHAIRIYELLKQYEKIGSRQITLMDLREYCGISEDQYKKYNNIRINVIERAIKEINKKTDILIEYEEKRKGRKVDSIIFNISSNDQKTKSTFEKNEKEYCISSPLMERLKEYGFSNIEFKRNLQKYDENVIKKGLEALDVEFPKGNIRNPKGWLLKAFEGGWQSNTFKENKASNSPKKLGKYKVLS